MYASSSDSLSVVVPVYNEGMKILEGIRRVEEAVLRRYPSELILVDDGSSPTYRPDYDHLLRLMPDLRILRGSRNRGKGHAVKQGVLASRGARVLYTDADIAYDLDLLPAYLLALREGADLAVGCRIHPDSSFRLHPRHFPYIYQRQLMGATFNRLVNRILRIQIKDTQCGFKCMRGEVARDLFRQVTLEGFAFEVEVLFLARKHGYSIQQMPVRLSYRGHPSSVRMIKDSVRMVLALLRIRRNEMGGKYERAPT